MRHIEITEIRNGYVVKFFADYPSPAKLDYTFFYETIEDALTDVAKWVETVEKEAAK